MKKLLLFYFFFSMIFVIKSTQAEICPVGQACGFPLFNLSPRNVEIANMIPGHIYQCNFGADSNLPPNVSFQFLSNMNPSFFTPSILFASPMPSIILFSGGVFSNVANDYVVFQVRNITSMTQSRLFIYCFPLV